VAGRAAVAGIVLALAIPVSAVPSAVRDASATATAPARWRDAGVVMSSVPTTFTADASTAGVFVGVGTRAGRTTLARHAGGHWQRATLRIGAAVGVDVNDSGDAVALSVRGDGAVLSTEWRRGARRPRTSVIVPPRLSPRAPTAELVANGRGDLAALVRSDRSPSVLLVRKPLRTAWAKPTPIGLRRYHGVLDSIDVGNGGMIVGAFRHGARLTTRSWMPRASAFGPARPVTTWREPGRHPAATDVHADIAIGRDGDVATVWSYRLGGSRTALLNVLPTGGRRFEKRIANAAGHDLAAVGDDGSVLLTGGLRWSPHSRRLVTGSSLIFLDADSRGDALMGQDSHRGRLALWPIGGPQGPQVATPSGRQVDAVLTTDLVVYLVIDGPGNGLGLRVRQF
jgi:hypothetical protein